MSIVVVMSRRVVGVAIVHVFEILRLGACLLNGVDFASCKFAPRLFLASSVNVSVLSLQSVTIDVVLGNARIDRVSCFATPAADGLVRSSWRLTTSSTR